MSRILTTMSTMSATMCSERFMDLLEHGELGVYELSPVSRDKEL